MPDNVFRRRFLDWENMYSKIARGKVPGVLYNHKFGRSEGITTTEETVWDGGTLYAGWLAAAETVTLLSGSAQDGAGGTGALTVQIYGLDANWDEIDEVITMDGDTGTGATSTQEYLRLNRMKVITSGSNNTNVGAITATSDTGSVAMAKIGANYGQTLMALWSVPRNYTAYIYYMNCSVGKGDDATFYLYAKPSTGSWNLKYTDQVFQQSHQPVFDVPRKFEEKTDIDVRVIAGTGSVASAEMLIVYIQNPAAQ